MEISVRHMVWDEPRTSFGIWARSNTCCTSVYTIQEEKALLTRAGTVQEI